MAKHGAQPHLGVCGNLLCRGRWVTAPDQIHEGADNRLPGFDAAVMATVDGYGSWLGRRRLCEYLKCFWIHRLILLDGVALSK
jgi:hypothetical protein